MLYGFRDGADWVIVAADSLDELDTFAASPPEGINFTEVDAFTLMVDSNYSGLNRAYRVNASASVIEITKVRAGDVQRNMRINDPSYDDPYSTHSKENRTIREISGYDKHDPYDVRTDAQKEEDAKFRAAIEDYKNGKTPKDSTISGESFSPVKSNVGVTGITGIREADGKITITDVMAQKGLWEDREEEVELPPNPMRINTDTFKKLYRVDVQDIDLTKLDELFTGVPALEVDKMIVQRGNFDEDGSTGVWLVSGIQRLALKINDALRAIEPSLVTEVYAVNTENERLVPKGVEVVDTDAPREIGPRPWNDRAAEWHAWTDEERAEEIKTNVRGDEFVYAGTSKLTGSTLYITPLDYFQKTGVMWEESLPIAHLLPLDLKEKEPGHYHSTARDWNTMTYNIGQQGIRESWFLHIYLNNLGQ